MARKADLKAEFEKGSASGFTHCSWNANGIQCLFPGSISHSVGGSGPWFCRWHFDCTDPVFGQQVVDESKSYRHPTETEKLRKQTVRAIENLDQYGLARLPDEEMDEWVLRMRKFVRENVRNIGKIRRERKAA